MNEKTTLESKDKKVRSSPQRGARPSRQNGNVFINETKFELSRVTWPTREKVAKATGLVLIIVTVAALFVAGIDYLLSQLFLMIKGS